MVGALVDNALRHTPRDGHVVIEGQAVGGRVELAVRDDGPGISDEDMPHVFERFYRVDPAPEQAVGSSGLGLSIVRALAMAQGGGARVEHVAPHGARFVLTVPGARVPHMA